MRIESPVILIMSLILSELQDISRLFKQEENLVRVSLVESNQILGSFDQRLQKFAEKKISQRDRFHLLKTSVTGK